MTDLTFIHLSDLHFQANEEDLQPGFTPRQNFQRILDALRALEIQPDFFVISGDLSTHGDLESYELVKTSLTELEQFNCPLLLGLGNHDQRVPFRQVILGEDETDETKPYYHSHLFGEVRVIVLDSKLPDHVEGWLDEAQLTWLAGELAQPVPGGNLIFLHHPLHIGPVKLLNDHLVGNHARLAEILAGHKILGVLYGHIHYPNIGLFHGILSVATPAVGYVMDPGVQDSLRGLASCGFAIGNIRQDQLYVNPITLSYPADEIFYISPDQWQTE